MSSDANDHPASPTDEETQDRDDDIEPETSTGSGDSSTGVTETDQAAAGAATPQDTAFVWNDSERSENTDRTAGVSEATARDGTETARWDTGNHAEGTSSEPDGPAAITPERYLLAGETIVDHHEMRAGWVTVTTHRLLTFDPEGDGTRFETVDRPNVVAVRTAGGGSPKIKSSLWRALGYGVVLLGGGLVGRSMGLRSLFSTPTGADTGAVGINGLLSVLSLVGVVVGLVVDLLLVAGVVAALAALGLGVWYLRSRQPTLVVERAGEAEIILELPTAATGSRVVDALERELRDELAVGNS